jgi:hypothetical protein
MRSDAPKERIHVFMAASKAGNVPDGKVDDRDAHEGNQQPTDAVREQIAAQQPVR